MSERMTDERLAELHDSSVDCTMDEIFNALKAERAKVRELKRTNEIQIMQLAGCMTVSFANTRESLAKVLTGIHPDYQCQAINDVADAVRREIRERDRAEASETNFATEHDALKAAEAKLKAVEGLRKRNVTQILTLYGQHSGRQFVNADELREALK
jgi:hypothetical protein